MEMVMKVGLLMNIFILNTKLLYYFSCNNSSLNIEWIFLRLSKIHIEI